MPVFKNEMREDQCRQERGEQPDFGHAIAGSKQCRREQHERGQSAECRMEKSPAAFEPGAKAHSIMQVSEIPEGHVWTLRDSQFLIRIQGLGGKSIGVMRPHDKNPRSKNSNASQQRPGPPRSN